MTKPRTTISLDSALHLDLTEMQLKLRRAWGRKDSKLALADVALRRYLDDLSAALERGEAPPAGLLPGEAPASATSDSVEAP